MSFMKRFIPLCVLGALACILMGCGSEPKGTPSESPLKANEKPNKATPPAPPPKKR